MIVDGEFLKCKDMLVEDKAESNDSAAKINSYNKKENFITVFFKGSENYLQSRKGIR